MAYMEACAKDQGGLEALSSCVLVEFDFPLGFERIIFSRLYDISSTYLIACD
jgi:hypothetical protein